MAWYSNIFRGRTDEEKLNPAQVFISQEEGMVLGSTENVRNYTAAYEQFEVVNRAVNLVVDDCIVSFGSLSSVSE